MFSRNIPKECSSGMFPENVPHLHKYPRNTVLLSKAAFRMYVIVDREKGINALSVRAAFDRVEKT
jgi:hypothetical protein